ncbi:hypothetical protein TNCV_4013241 [Trichonephila clavipes]|nr:hypothetical protein TNCV_4013241 [Trichonephila clavipes]
MGRWTSQRRGQSSDAVSTSAGAPLSKLPHLPNWRILSHNRLNFHQPLYMAGLRWVWGSNSGHVDLELLTLTT